MDVRRNKEGKILYVDAWELVECCLQNGIFTMISKNGESYIPIYRNGSETDPEKYPEGWYLSTKDAVIYEVMNNENEYMVLIEQLKKKGISFYPSMPESILNMVEEMMEYAPNEEEMGE